MKRWANNQIWTVHLLTHGEQGDFTSSWTHQQCDHDDRWSSCAGHAHADWNRGRKKSLNVSRMSTCKTNPILMEFSSRHRTKLFDHTDSRCWQMCWPLYHNWYAYNHLRNLCYSYCNWLQNKLLKCLLDTQQYRDQAKHSLGSAFT